MDTRSKLFKTNTEFIGALDHISTINGKITEIETFSSNNAEDNNPQLLQYKEEMNKAEVIVDY